MGIIGGFIVGCFMGSWLRGLLRVGLGSDKYIYEKPGYEEESR